MSHGLIIQYFFVLGSAKKDKNNHFNEKNGTAKLILREKVLTIYGKSYIILEYGVKNTDPMPR